jgi:hypothetical protein
MLNIINSIRNNNWEKKMAKTFGRLIGLILTAILALSIIGCSAKEKKEAQKTNEQPRASVLLNSVGGLTWMVPQGWRAGQAGVMRAATYIIDPVTGDKDGAECGVYFFDSGQGGTVQGNLDRWIGQMEQPNGKPSADMAKIEKFQSNELQITTVELTGTYRNAAGPMMQVKEKKPGYRLKGAIVEGPKGSVFFKITGPDNTVMAAAVNFMALLKSCRVNKDLTS